MLALTPELAFASEIRPSAEADYYSWSLVGPAGAVSISFIVYHADVEVPISSDTRVVIDGEQRSVIGEIIALHRPSADLTAARCEYLGRCIADGSSRYAAELARSWRGDVGDSAITQELLAWYRENLRG